MNDLERHILATIGGNIDEVRLAGDDNSFVEMDQGVIHVCSDRFGGEFYFKVRLEPATEADYFKSIWHDETKSE